MKRAEFCKVKTFRITFDTVGISHRKLHRKAHVRHAHTRNHRFIDKLHKAVNDAFAMDNDVDFALRKIEQVHCLDNFQALVHHRRAVDGNFRAHCPDGMFDCHLRRYRAQLFVGEVEKRTARRRQRNLFDVLNFARFQALENRAVFRIDGNNRGAVSFGLFPEKSARSDDGLFVCDTQRAAVFRTFIDGFRPLMPTIPLMTQSTFMHESSSMDKTCTKGGLYLVNSFLALSSVIAT